jgi:argininosuccinate synthase
VLEDPWVEPPPYVYQRTIAPRTRPTRPPIIEIGFEKGDPGAGQRQGAVARDAAHRSSTSWPQDNGIGRLDLVENRFVGMKSRGVYETPGGTILLHAHRAIESITLDRGAGHLKDELMPRYAELIYNGFWFAPEREMLQALIDKSQEHVTGTVRSSSTRAMSSWWAARAPKSLYKDALVTFEDDRGAYDQKDAAGFIRSTRLRLRVHRQPRDGVPAACRSRRDTCRHRQADQHRGPHTCGCPRAHGHWRAALSPDADLDPMKLACGSDPCCVAHSRGTIPR